MNAKLAKLVPGLILAALVWTGISPDTAHAARKAKTQIVCDDFEGGVGEVITLTAQLSDLAGKPLQGKTIFFSVRDELGLRTIGRAKTDANGMASYDYAIQWVFASERETSRILKYAAKYKGDKANRATSGKGSIVAFQGESADDESGESEEAEEEFNEEIPATDSQAAGGGE